MYDLNMRDCNRAFAKMQDIDPSSFLDIHNKFDINKFCSNITEIANLIKKCNNKAYLYGKTEHKLTNVLYNSNTTVYDPREKAKYYLDNFPDIRGIQEICKIFDGEDYFTPKEKEIFEFNKEVLNNLLDTPKFIHAMYNYIWNCVYSYAITTLWLTDFIEFVITTINAKTRDNYIICKCNEFLKQSRMVSYLHANVYDYTCGRALGIITEPNVNTRFVIYNTIDDTNDDMDETHFSNIKKLIIAPTRLPTPRLPTPRLPTPRLPTPRLPTPRLPTPRTPQIPITKRITNWLGFGVKTRRRKQK